MLEHDHNTIGWIVAGILGIFNIITGFIIIPVKSKVNATEQRLNACKISAGERLGKMEGKIYHYEAESKRHENDIGEINSKLDNLSTKITTVEAIGITHQASLSRMEKKMDTLLSQGCGG